MMIAKKNAKIVIMLILVLALVIFSATGCAMNGTPDTPDVTDNGTGGGNDTGGTGGGGGLGGNGGTGGGGGTGTGTGGGR